MAAPGPWKFTNSGLMSLITGVLDLDSDTFKLALFQSTSNIGPSSTTYAGLTNEVANGNGYTTGGASCSIYRSGTTTVTVLFDAVTFTASGAGITARYAVIYEVGGTVLAYCELDSAPADVSIAPLNVLVVGVGQDEIFSIAPA